MSLLVYVDLSHLEGVLALVYMYEHHIHAYDFVSASGLGGTKGKK